MQRRNKLLIALMIMTVFAGRTQATVDNVSTWSGLSNSITAGNSATLTGDIASDVTSTITNSNSVATAISVDFATHVINANSSTGAILNNGTLTLKSGTLENFKSSTGVSALKNTKNLTIDSQIVDNNNVISPTDDAQGGGIYNGSSAILTVQNSSTISNNTATTTASGKVGSGGGIYNEGTTNITGSTVKTNTATYGGGIYNNYPGTTTLDSSTVDGNKAISTTVDAKGGGLYNSSSATLTVQNGSTISNNSATTTASGKSGYGGGIFNYGTTNITGSTVKTNTATNGGGIYNESGTTTLSSATKVTSNTAVNGAGVYNKTGGTVTVDGSNVDSNTATSTTSTSHGGGIYNNGTLKIQNSSTVSNNIVGYGGGGIYNDGAGTATIDNSTINGNTATSAVYNTAGAGILNYNTLKIQNGSTISNNIASTTLANGNAHGGGIYNDNSGTTDIIASTVKSNTATDGGGIYNKTGIVTVDNSNVNGNTAVLADSFSGTGGGILNDSNATLKVKNGSTISSNTAADSGGGIYNLGTTTIDSSTVDGNKATSTTYDAEGGGIYNDSTLNIQNGSTISNNSATTTASGYSALGGGIFNNDTTNITGSNVNSNTATSGGGIYNESGTTTIDSNSVLLSNSASSEGGAIYNQGTKVAVSNSTLLNNKVESSTNAVYGGAVSNEAGTLVLDSSYVLNNKANSTSTSTSYDALGAGIYNKATLTVTNSTISGNTATSSSENANGGGIYNIDTTTVTGSTIKSNTATDGGGIYNYYGTTTIDSSTVDGNKATSTTYYAKGGAIYNDSGATLVVKNGSTLSNNSAEDFGGAIYNGGTATISDTTISTNSTNQKNGGGIQNSGTLTVSNSNFNGNTAALYGGAIANDIGATATITDTSFKNNTAGNGGGAIHNEGTVTIIATGSQAIPADVVFEGNTEGGSSNAIYNKNGVLNLNATGDAENNGRIVFKDKIRSTGTINVNATNADVATIPAGSPTTGTVVLNNDMTGVQGMVKFYNGTIQLDDGGTMFADSATLDVMPNSTTPATINFQNAPIATYGLSNLVLGGDLNLKVKADLAAKQMTQIKATSLAGDGKIIVNDIALTSEATQDSTSIAFADDTLKNTVSYSGGKVAYSPIYKYSVDYDKNTGNFGFTRPSTAKTNDFNPAVLPAPVASQMGGYFSQLNSYNQGFRPMDTLMHLTRLERLSMRDRNKYAIVDTPASGTGSTPLYRESAQKGLWVNPYTTFEDVSIKNGPDVSGISYGSYFGGDSDLYELKHGWEALYSLYAGYNGAYQSFGSVHSDQNGGTLGLSGTWFKGNFFSGLTVNAGGTSGQSHTMYGTDNYVMISSGVAGRLGYNWEMFEGKFVIQPSFTMSYSFVDTLPYTSASNVRITSDALNAITFQPQLKFIANMKNGWQPYAAVAMIWSAMDKSKFYANDQALPEMSIDPFVQYGVGIQRSWADRFTAQGQAMARSGGRNGVALSFILKWAVGQLTDPDLMRRESEEFDRSL